MRSAIHLDGAARRGAAFLSVLTALLAGCSSNLAVPSDGGPRQDGAVDLSGYLTTAPCGGTVSLTGSTPDGVFDGDRVNVLASYGGTTNANVTVSDSRTGWALNWHHAWSPADGGTSLPPATNVLLYANFVTAPGAVTMVSGTVSITSATNPAALADAGAGGTLDATMTFSGGGFSLAGSLSSPYCSVGPALGPSD